MGEIFVTCIILTCLLLTPKKYFICSRKYLKQKCFKDLFTFIKVNKSQYIALFVFSESNLYPINCVSIYLFSILLLFQSNLHGEKKLLAIDCINLFSIFF